MIIVIRGTNGSGKSHAVRRLLDAGWLMRENLPEGSCVIRIPRVTRPVLIVGPYEQGRSMGGCDCIRQPSKIYDLIRWAEARKFHVVLEGVVLAERPYCELFRQGHDVRLAIFDPPFTTCLENIRERQARKGHVSQFSIDAMKHKRKRALMMYGEARRIGMPAIKFTEPGFDGADWILSQLRSA